MIFCHVVYTEHCYEDHDSLNYRELYSNRSFECGKKRNSNIAPYNSVSYCVDAQITRLFFLVQLLIPSRKNLRKNRRRIYMRDREEVCDRVPYHRPCKKQQN